MLARERKLPGIVIQANPYLESPKHNEGQPNGYLEFIDQLLTDPRSDETIRNFMRVETYGSPTMGWVKGTVDTADPKLFRFEARPYKPD